MSAFKCFVLGVAALTSVYVSTANAGVVEARQDMSDIPVGSNLYNCHDNCGQAINEEAIAGFCNSTIFSTDYAACLQCAGTDNENIWQYYGSYLTAGAAQCGSATTPLTGTQANISTALVAQNATSATAATTSTTLSGSSTTATGGATGKTTSASKTGSASTPTTTTSGSDARINGPQVLVAGGLSLVAIFVAGLLN